MNSKDLPTGSAPRGLEYPHFPTRWQAVVWRNWNLVPVERIALTLRATPPEIEAAATAMGLVRDDGNLAKWAERGFLTVIRRNWDLLPYEQLLTLLDWSAERLAFVLKEDDFMWHKMGDLKPSCEAVYYHSPTLEEIAATAELRQVVERHFGDSPAVSDPPFAFLERYGRNAAPRPDGGDSGLKMIYSYSATYGDPLLNESSDPYPEGLLADYAAAGVNAVWLQGTLYTLVPWLGEGFPGSAGWQARQENLTKLIDRAARYGIAVFLYMNEPRNLPASFFEEYPEWRGVPDVADENFFALCTSHKPVLEALGEGVERLFREVPGLGGLFTITMSENLTHCHSRRRGHLCPRCAERPPAEIVAEVNQVMAAALRRSGSRARMLAWSWAWDPEWAPDVVRQLPPEVTLMCVSENRLATDCFGIPGEVQDYSISKVGPGPVAERLWREARQRGLSVAAKVQFNSSWELAAVPYIPVPGLIERHRQNLKAAGVNDFLLSWTLGGYPGGNLELLTAAKEELALRKFGEAAPKVLQAWECFARAFELFPLDGFGQLYYAPQNFGPMNLLWAEPTRRVATMIGFPWDDLESWRGDYPVEVFERAFRELSEGWGEGLRILREADSEQVGELYTVAEAVYCHFRSTYHQIAFVRTARPDLLDAEIDLAKRLWAVMRRDSRIGFEASNHYLYVENDLLEKVINCEHLKRAIRNRKEETK